MRLFGRLFRWLRNGHPVVSADLNSGIATRQMEAINARIAALAESLAVVAMHNMRERKREIDAIDTIRVELSDVAKSVGEMHRDWLERHPKEKDETK